MLSTDLAGLIQSLDAEIRQLRREIDSLPLTREESDYFSSALNDVNRTANELAAELRRRLSH